ncbi:hypothetical protein DD238_004128 [Peronospora effusa]|uniref:DNA repair protein XRCC4 n=1 Tax=Peronospora effusa TaxID=542832 RepID=A0A3M6VFR8_9STRA|nr:hypothetical protein DD238_004128 [Peronospora effusa]
MSLAEVDAVDADSTNSSSSLSLFVHCSRTTSSTSSSKGTPLSIHVQLVDPPTLYEADVASSHKPRALDCSGTEYVATVESALMASSSDQSSRFEFRWSKQKRLLTLMERAGFAMKFCSIEFQASEDVATWRELLHQVATQQRENSKLILETENKVKHCETVLKQKEALLETALIAKQKVEDDLFQGFCAVLNTKKDEIRRLQFEIEKVQDMHKYEMKPMKKRKVVAPKGNKKAIGAKLKRKIEEEEEEEEEEEMSDGSNEGNFVAREEDDDDNDELKRAKNDAINAYSALPPNLRSSSVQISSAEDVLSRMDDIIKNEEEEDEATQREGNSRSGRSIISEPTQPRTRKTAALKVEPTLVPQSDSEKTLRPVSQVDEAMDLEEEDILDMLS